MTPTLQPGTAPHFDPRLIEIATRRAHELRNQAIDEALHQLGRWLRRPFITPRKTIAQEQPCHS